MKFTAFKLTIAMTVAVFYLNLCLAQPVGNLIQNWNFSSPNGLSIPDWSYTGFMWSAYNGVGGGSFVGINTDFSQTLATQPGQTYMLQFYTTTEIPGVTQSGSLYGLSVTWDTQSPISYSFTQQAIDWMPEDLLVTASSSETTLSFNRLYGAIPYLDDVSLVAVPEPNCITLFTIGISFIGVWRMFPVLKRLKTHYSLSGLCGHF